jgi:glycosyltransferase involved in cell wall biosynthesis
VLCVGGKQEDYFSEICSEIEHLNLQNRVTILYQISDANLKWLYNHAVLFVNPSLEEGFGRTPVEAIMHGVPVLTTKETSLYEVTLGLLDYIDDPDDPQEISNKIMNILESGVAYNVNSIKERYIEEYKPKRIAQKYWDLFLKTDDESAISQ